MPLYWQTIDIRAALLGLAVGDALGVPVEFQPRDALDRNPVNDMRAFGTHQQPAGTWSDDTSLTLCLADSLASCGPDTIDLADLCRRFVSWLDEARWTARGAVFDIGIATREAIGRMATGTEPRLCGGFDEFSNGNGSLMRILPLAFWLRDQDPEARRKACFDVSAVTHAHSRSKLACWLYVEIARELSRGHYLPEAIALARATLEAWLPGNDPHAEWRHFDRCTPAIAALPRHSIQSSGYVVHTLEASLWCLLTSLSYPEAVLKAVNLGSDTDTTAAVTGGLAGIIHGIAGIPADWLTTLARRDDIEALADRLYRSLASD